MKQLTALLIGAGLVMAEPSLSLEEAQNAARFCYGAGAGISYRVVNAALEGNLVDGMHPFRFDCRVEEHQGGIRVILYLDDQPLEDTATWVRPPVKASDKMG